MTRDIPRGGALVVIGAAATWLHALPLIRAAQLDDGRGRARTLRREAWHVLGAAWGVVVGVGARLIVTPPHQSHAGAG